MDGTLLDSSEDIATSVNFVRSSNHDLAPLSVDDVVKFINLPKRNLSKLFYG
ncbi:MAG: HAD family hydrolase, partial [Sulfuricurvum sp.]